MLDFISKSPPQTTFWLGLTTGALIADTIERVLKKKFRNVSGTDG